MFVAESHIISCSDVEMMMKSSLLKYYIFLRGVIHFSVSYLLPIIFILLLCSLISSVSISQHVSSQLTVINFRFVLQQCCYLPLWAVVAYYFVISFVWGSVVFYDLFAMFISYLVTSGGKSSKS